MADTPGSEQSRRLVETARRLWRGSFHGVLSTHSAAHPGYPFGTVAPFCLDRDGLPLLLLSHLAQHAVNLLQNPACGLLLSESGDGDVQQLARLSLVGDCRPLERPDAAESERYFRYFPQARPYFEQLNFRFFRLQPRQFHLNAGFAAARWLGPDRVVTPRPFDPNAESALRELAKSRQSLLERRLPGDGNARVAGIDASGMDLGRGEALARVEFPCPVTTPDQLTAALAQLAAT